MEKYNIELKEILVKEFEIEAKSIDDAICIVEKLYKNEEIVLDYSDHNTTNIDVRNLEPFSNNSDFLSFVLFKAEKEIQNLSAEELAKIGFGNLSNAIKEFLKDKN